MEIILATGNAHKVKEMQDIFTGHKILSPKELGIDFSFEETGSTFMENSLGKAQALFEIIKKPVLADDSGICVDALYGAPGIFSARYGATPDQPELDSLSRNALLVKNMTGKTLRTARFICALSLILSKSQIYCVQESVEGEVLETPRGEGGFGYDPLFYMPPFERTMAELTAEEKNSHSHRGIAGAKLAALLSR